MALIDKASLLMVPSTYEAGTLYNVLPSGNRAPDSTDQNSGYDQTRADFTFDRGSNAAATRVNADGLIEKYRENLLLQSNAFNTSPFIKSNVSLSSGQEGYNGGSDAWELSTTGVNGFENLYQNLSFTGVNTISIYAKKGTNVYLTMRSLTSDFRVQFKLDDGTHSTTYGSPIDTFMFDAGNGWYRCGFTANFSGATSLVLYPQRIGITDAGSIYIQNAQLESSMVATDYLDSGATTAKAGVLIDLPRINYDANGENGALLLEPQRSNLLTQSEYFGASYWSKANVDFELVDTLSPEGKNNSYKITETTASGQHLINVFSSYRPNLSAGSHTHSCFVKANGVNDIVFYNNGSSGGGGVNIDLSDGTYSNLTGTATSASVEPYGNDWYRISLTFTATAGNTAPSIYLRILGNYVGDGVSGIYMYGMQTEAGSYPTSYIPNHGTSGGVTRAADSCSVTGVSDVIGQTEGTLFVDAVIADEVDTEGYYFRIDQTSYSNTILFSRSAAGNAFASLRVGGSTIYTMSENNIPNRVKLAFAYKSGDSVLYMNGSEVDSSSATYTMATTLEEIRLGSYSDTTANMSGDIKQAALFKERLSNAELATLTTL